MKGLSIMTMIHRDARPGAIGSSILWLVLAAGPAAGAQGVEPAAGKPESRGRTIADFDDGKLETVSGLSLVALADEQLGGHSEARLSLLQPGAQASRGAVRISFRLADGFARPFAAVWAMVGPEGLATDLSEYRGLRFYARGEGGSFQAGVGQFSGRLRLFMAPFEAKREWTLVEVPFDRLELSSSAKEKPPFVPRDVTTVGISVAPGLRGQFEVELDQLELYK
jgi:hypothetical protein